MNYKTPSMRGFLKKSIGISIILMLSLIFFSCKNQKSPPQQGDPLKEAIRGLDPRDSLWASWNVLLSPGLDYATRSSAIQGVENELIAAFNRLFIPPYTLHLQVYYCPCDSSLYNIGAKVLGGSGQSVTTPPPPTPPGGSGDVLFVSNNNKVVEPIRDSIPLLDTSHKLALNDPFKVISIDDSTTLAIIDTGLDPDYFSPEIRELIWSGDGSGTIYNVVDPTSNSPLDDHPGRHGTVVTAIALKALKDQNNVFRNPVNRLPKLMILKALDKDKKGSTFSVSCALSYAVKHKVAAVNASLGYYDRINEVDLIFRHYIELSNTQTTPIKIFAAAGNIPTAPNPSTICSTPVIDLLSMFRFYPGCFSVEFNNVFTITTLSNTSTACFYQNYSPVYVSLGVIQTGMDCCHFSVPFAKANGSSFATPVAAGTGLSYVLNGQAVNDFMRLANRETSSTATKDGKYFNYSSN